MFCKYCGSSVSDQAVFCSKCGKPVSGGYNTNAAPVKVSVPSNSVHKTPNQGVYHSGGEAVHHHSQNCSCHKPLSGNAPQHSNPAVEHKPVQRSPYLAQKPAHSAPQPPRASAQHTSEQNPYRQLSSSPQQRPADNHRQQSGTVAQKPAQNIPQQNIPPVQQRPVNNVPQQNIPRQMPVQNAAHQSSAVPIKLYMPSKASFVNYRFQVKDEQGNIKYTVCSGAQGFNGYKVTMLDLNQREVILVKQKSQATFTAVNFEGYINGQFVTDMMHKATFARYYYEMPQLGLKAVGDFIGCRYTVVDQADNVVARISKKVMAWGDDYEIDIADSRNELLILAITFAVQMMIVTIRHRRRR